MDNTNKLIYYAELKSNLSLDTEKSKPTIDKCIFVKEELEQKYPEYTVHMMVLGLGYLYRDFRDKKFDEI